MITGKNITLAFSGAPILDGVDFKLVKNRKIGIVGKNGCGKTTLFKVIIGELTPDNGSMDMYGEKIGYISQEFNFPNELVGEYLEKALNSKWEEYKIDMLVTSMEFDNYDPYQEINTLSEGQKMKVKMIEAMLSEPTTLLIDEPTNHLDIEGIMWFENYIKDLEKTVVMISHDREFLNNTVDEIWEIENKKIIRFVGNYDFYKEEKLKLIDKWNVEYVQFLRQKAKLETLLENVRKIKDGKSRGRAVSSAKKRMEREITSKPKEKYESKIMDSVSFNTEITSSKLMIRFSNVAKAYGTKLIFEDLSFEVRGGQKVWLFGPNGYGKTTIVKMLMGEEDPTSGEVILGNNIKVGYFAQKQTHLDYEKRLMDAFVEQTGCYFGSAYGVLEKFLFSRDDLAKKIKNLSPGQRARFAFAIFAYKDYDLLILDEPSNHLDIETKEVIEESLKDYKGTMLLVSHDRFFVERVGITNMLNLKEGSLTQY